MATFNVDEVDLADLARTIEANRGSLLRGAVVGRTQMRDLVADHLGCSVLQAEQLVDTLIGRGFAHLASEADDGEVWQIRGGN